MQRIVLSFSFFLFVVSRGFSQDLYVPRNVAQAYKNQTRSADGKPGRNYWQNRAKYRIMIAVAPPDRIIKGTERITYYNNSPDTIRNPIIKLFLNIHKPGAPRARGTDSNYLSLGTHIDRVTENDQPLAWHENPVLYTWQTLRLNQPVAPHDSVNLSFDWHFQISRRSGREGMIDSTTYFLAYFYPRIAVYDDCSGWDRMNFIDIQEFYSDFNDYDVTIQVPKNFLVWGTGTLQHADLLLQPEYLKKFNKSFSSDQTIRVATKDELRQGLVTAQQPVNSWEFTASDIPDMAFGVSDHFDWDAASVVVDGGTGRRASVQSAFNDTASDYHYMVQFGRHALSWLSQFWPGVPYPYEKTTIFQGFAGMEYPMMANDESYADTVFARFVAEHEIAHTYMPFYMGINETRYGFMDEGWATTFEALIGRSDLGITKADEFYKQFRVAGWIRSTSPDQDLPIITPGDALCTQGLGSNEYGKPSLGYLAMKDLLGDDLFKKCLHAYMDRWHGKHPIPWDFFYTFNDVSGRNLNWFWKNWFFSNYYIDLGVREVTKTADGYQVTIQNIGGMDAPVDLKLSYEDGSNETKHLSPEIWQANENTARVDLKTTKTIKKLLLDGGIFMDADTSNNSWPK